MATGSCPPRDAWLGFRDQLWPKMSYGLVAVSHPPDKLDAAFQSVWFKCLPCLKVNRHITKAWQTLPWRFQGLAMPEVNMKVLGRKIHLIQRHWGCGDATGRMLKQAYEVFQVEAGLEGNIIAKDFRRNCCLVTHGWFKNLWELCDRYGVTFEILGHHLPLLRAGSESIMGKAVRLSVWTTKELIRLNRVRKYKKLFDLGDATRADGITVTPCVLDTSAGESSWHFPLERPSRADFTLWLKAWRVLSSPGPLSKKSSPKQTYSGFTSDCCLALRSAPTSFTCMHTKMTTYAMTSWTTRRR